VAGIGGAHKLLKFSDLPARFRLATNNLEPMNEMKKEPPPAR